MNERFYLDTVTGRKTGGLAAWMRAVFWLLTPVYWGVVAGRNCLFDTGLKRTHDVDVPIVSVGNITTGGTGKTPVVAWVAEWLKSRGVHVCLVSRGYRALDAAGNDEQRVLEQLCPGVPHVQNRDRVAAAQHAVKQYKAEVLVLDDGFQHRRLHRDLDIVLLDATNPWGYGYLLPRGLMREPRSALRRANVVVLTRVDQVDQGALVTLREEVQRETQAPVTEVTFRPIFLRSLTGETASVESLVNERVFAFCGIGNPKGFRRTLRDTGVSITDDAFRPFVDHHHYTQREFEQLVTDAISQGATALVTTQKDLVKLDSAWSMTLPVWAVVIGAEVVAGRTALEAVLMSVVDANAGRN